MSTPPKNSSDLFNSDTASSSESLVQSDKFMPERSDAPELFTQRQLNDLVTDLNLPEAASELLGSRLKRKKLTSCCRLCDFLQAQRKRSCTIL